MENMELNLNFEEHKHKKKCTFSINPDLVNEFDKICKKNKWKKSNIIEEVLRSLISKNQNEKIVKQI